jgi:UDP-N-acetylglucosamine diphosphorylase/glucosamine-1-phosphate N-acetyltransferase
MQTPKENSSRPAVVILAAGKGTRMNSDLPKVLHRLGGRPLLAHGLDLARKLDAQRIVVVVGCQAELVRQTFSGEPGLRFALQEPQLGTGHAVMAAAPELNDWRGPVLILCGDVPGLRPETMRALLERRRSHDEALTVLGMDLPEPWAYGRLVINGRDRLERIVEYCDASQDERRITLVNAGVYAAQAEPLLHCLPLLDNQNAQGEYYLTDLVELMNARGLRVGYALCPDPAETAGVNTPQDLARLEQALSGRSKEN